MKRYPINNIDIDYDGIQFACHLSKNRIKKAAYIKDLAKYNVKVRVYWHYGWDEPVVYIPSYVDVIGECIGDLIGLGKYLGWR